jgi:hypothetical protein
VAFGCSSTPVPRSPTVSFASFAISSTPDSALSGVPRGDAGIAPDGTASRPGSMFVCRRPAIVGHRAVNEHSEGAQA